ncbi:MAG TPA: ADP-ribosylglycohydrolase family protein [Syntrophomonas sp.]|nr:ADP-ribosylglycohydrolase family protein [Syntrophomonas sp.]
MFGAIAGDVIGSAFEFNNIKRTDFKLFSMWSQFTDDTVLTVAVADCILHGKDYGRTIRDYGLNYPDAGYGGRFYQWLHAEAIDPYNSFGNGSAMRVSPVGFAFDTYEQVMEEAAKSAAVTHNHPEGIKGAQAIAAAVFLARSGLSKAEIKGRIEADFGYDLNLNLGDLRKTYKFDVTCQGSVPQAIVVFLKSRDYEDAIRKAVSIGGDSDTIACMAGGIAHAYYKSIPAHIVKGVRALLYQDLLDIIDEFAARYGY